MYCDRCGTQMNRSAAFCPGCGKRFMPLMPAENRLDGHIRLIGILWLALSAMRLIPGVLLIVASGAITSWLPPEVPRLVVALIPVVTAVLWVNLLLGFAAGYALLTRQSWGRTAAIAMAILNLWDLPFGTALSVYSLWALLPAEHREQYRQITEQHATGF